jgi:DNA-binding transcriptional regulator GbsR (MarR family)
MSKDTDAPVDARLEPLVEVTGNTPRIRLIAALILSDDDMNMSDISEDANLASHVFYDNIEPLLDAGAVEQTRKVGNRKFYDVVDDHPGVTTIRSFLESTNADSEE